MQFIVEDGTGLSDATSYISVEEFKEILDSFGYVYAGYLDNQIKSNLNVATLTLNSTYRNRWRTNGTVLNSTQMLDFPRIGATYTNDTLIVSDSVPIEVKNATAFMAYYSLVNNNLQPVFGSSTSGIQKEVTEIGPITESTTYFQGKSPDSTRDIYTAVSDALSKIIGAGYNANYIGIVRV